MTTESGIEKLLGLSVPALVAVAGFLSWIMLVNSLQIPYWLYYERTIYLIYLGRSLDPIAWLLSSVFAVLLLAGPKKGRSAWLWPGILLLWLGIALGAFGLAGMGRLGIVAGSLLTLIGLVVGANAVFKELASTSRGCFVAAILLVLSLLILPAELGSLSYYVLSAFQAGTQVGRSWELFELQLWYTPFPLVPLLYVAFLFAWISAPLVTKTTKRSRQPADGAERALDNWGWLLAMGGYVLLAIFLGYYAYFRDPTYPLVGTDIYWRNALPAERVLAWGSWIAAAAKERHPVVVLGIAVLSNTLRLGVDSLLRFAYVGLILAFGAAVFPLVLLASKNKMLASLAALMSTVSPPTTEGIYTGIIASWVSMIVWVLSLASIAISDRQGWRRFFVSLLGLGSGSLAVLFIHPWTWIAMMVGLIAYCLISVLFRLKNSRPDIAAILIVVLLKTAAITVSLVVLSNTQGWRVAEAFSLVQNTLGSKYFGLGGWEIVVFFSQIWSQFLNPVLLVLSILGILVLAQRRDRFAAIVFAWLIAACATKSLS